MFHFSIKIRGQKMKNWSLGIIAVILIIRLVKCLPLQDQETMESTSLIMNDESGSKQVIHQPNEVTFHELNDVKKSVQHGGFWETLLPMFASLFGIFLKKIFNI